MRKLLIGLGALLILLVAAVLILPSLVPASVYKDKIQQQVSASLGRDVEIKGDVKFSVLPSLRAKAMAVTIANDEGFSAVPFATMDSLEAKVKLMPLFKKQVEITEFTLVNPVITLEKTKTGKVNWAFGDDEPVETDVFARDGRYTDLDISLGTFALKNGKIDYVDAMSGKSYALDAVNMKMTMPGMDKPIAAKGDLVFNNTPMDMELMLVTPKAFLSGEMAPFTARLKSDLITLSADGKFTPSEQITFEVNFDSDIPSTAKLNALLGVQNPYEALTESAKLKGALSFDGANLKAKGADFVISSDIITTTFKGDFVAGGKPSAAGDLNIKISDLHKLQKTLGFDYPQTAAISSVNFATNLSTDGVTTKGKNVDLAIKGGQIDAGYKGGFTFDNALSLDGSFNAASPSVSALMSKLNMAAVPGADIIGDFSVTGRASGVIDKLSLSGLEFKTKGEALTANYQGDIKLGDTVMLNGRFDAQSPSAISLITKLGIEAPAAAKVLGDINVSGQVSGPADAVALSALNFKTKGAQLTASYVGDVKMGKTITLNGSFEALAPSIKTLAAETGMALPYADAVGKFTAKGAVSGTADALTISGLTAALTDGLLNLQFEGSAKTGKAVSYDGQLSANITSVRQLAALGGTALAPSTSTGEIYGPFALSGKATGTTTSAQFTGARVSLDALSGTGNFSANLAGGKPFIKGILDMQNLDIRPYQDAMYAQRPKGIQPWSEEPLNLSFLNMMDADFTLNTPNLIMSSMEMGQSSIKSTIKNGVLKTNIPSITLYGGQGSLDMNINAGGAVPQVAMDFTLANMNGKGFLGAAAGFTKLSGNTGTTMKFTGAGRSQAEIMRSLKGGGNFELAEGVISGVDIGQFVGGLDTALRSGALPSGIGNAYTTPFNKLDGLFTMNGGVVTIGDFKLNADTVLAEGGGTLDIGNQNVDFSLRPRLKEGNGLAAFGIPIRLKGNFGSISAGLDTQLLTQIMAARAKAELQNQITDKIGGDLGGIVGGILGNPQPQSQPTPSDEAAPLETTKPQDPLDSILGGLLGTQQQEEPQPETQPVEPTEPKKEDEKKEDVDPLEKALSDLFGGD